VEACEFDAMQRFRSVLRMMGSPKHRTAVVRACLQRIRIGKTDGEAVLRWAPLPRGIDEVARWGVRGLEPDPGLPGF